MHLRRILLSRYMPMQLVLGFSWGCLKVTLLLCVYAVLAVIFWTHLTMLLG